jgi:Lon protease-like protein
MSRTDPRDAVSLGAALEELPLFPLPGVVLMPGALLPLYVFEPRYRKMVRDALDGHQALGIVQLAEPASTDRNGQPAIARIAGAGTIIDSTELPNGRYQILLRGRARVSLQELPFVPPYRRARASVLASTDENVSSTATAALIAVATGFAALVRERDKSFDFRMPKLSDAGGIADHCAQHLLIDGRDRQQALETTSVVARVRIVTETLAMQQLSLSGAKGTKN